MDIDPSTPSGEEYTLRQLRASLGVTQAALAEALGTSQPAVLKTENATDLRLSTIRRYIGGLARLQDTDHDIHLTATLGGLAFRIRLPDDEPPPLDPPPSPPTDKEPTTMTTLSPTTTAWRLRIWDDPDLEAAMHDQGIIAISNNEIGDLTDWPSEAELARRLTDSPHFADRSAQAIGMFVTYWRYFRIEMAPGDLVAVPHTYKRVGIARVTGDYRYDPSQPPKLRHQRPVQWLRTIPRAELDNDIRKVVNAPGTICRINAHHAAQRLA